MTISGTLPAIVAVDYKYNGGDISSLEIKGNNVDVIFDDGVMTILEADWLGNGTFEIIDIDDNIGLFPEYEIGDVISVDVIKKAMLSSIYSSYEIFSFNLLGKVKYGIKDKVQAVGDTVGKGMKKVKKAAGGIKDWATDDLPKETAEKWLEKVYGTSVNVGQIDKLNNEDGATYKVLWGVPKQKKFKFAVIHRNGNDIRFLTEQGKNREEIYEYSAKEAEQCYNDFQNYAEGLRKVISPMEDAEESQKEEQQNNKVTGEQDGFEWEIVDASFKRKHSKYNGKNVTGYEDGMLGTMTAEASV